jgi:hypothetical protein
MSAWRPGALLPALAPGATYGARAAEPVAPGPPALRAEQALDRAVHLVWEGGGGERQHEIERRARTPAGWSPWAPVSAAAAAAGHVDDRGADGSGLPPGEYQYRIRVARPGEGRTGSDWSPPRSVRLREPCRAPLAPGVSLATVVAGDRDGDGRLTGRDLAAALEECSSRGGCVVELLPAVYDDVAVVLSDGSAAACSRARSACLKLPFPRGLVIQGHGSDSVLRSPLWTTPYEPAALLELWNLPDLRFALRNLVLDGRKDEQRDPVRGRNEHHRWLHHGFQSWNQWGDHSRRNRGGCIHGVTVRGFMSRGISLADASGWTIAHNTVEDIGCHEGLTPCSRLTIPDFGPMRGYTVSGYGILVGWHVDDLRIESNLVRRVTKYGIGLKHGSDGAETSIRRPRVRGNQIRDTGFLGIFVGGVEDGEFADNLIDSTHVTGGSARTTGRYDTFGFSCVGRVDGTRFERNEIRNSAGIAIGWTCRGRGNAISDNLVLGSCRQRSPASCGARRGACYRYPDVHVFKASGELELANLEVRESACAAPLAARGAGGPLELRIRGGRFVGGPHATDPVRFRDVDVTLSHAASFEEVALDFGPGSRGVVTESVRAPGRAAFRRAGGSRVLICARDPEACAARCAASPPPPWCDDVDGAPK